MNAVRLRRRPALEHAMTGHDFSFSKLGGGEIDLHAYAGRPMLVVNVASACGFTPQYRELQSLWDAKEKAGLIVLGVPCNEFGGQEKGSDQDIRMFCDATYHVTFPMTGKVEIIGPNRHPFYQWIAGEAGQEALPRWNFHKYLIGRSGALEASFPSSAAPLGLAVISAIDKALAA